MAWTEAHSQEARPIDALPPLKKKNSTTQPSLEKKKSSTVLRNLHPRDPSKKKPASEVLRAPERPNGEGRDASRGRRRVRGCTGGGRPPRRPLLLAAVLGGIRSLHRAKERPRRNCSTPHLLPALRSFLPRAPFWCSRACSRGQYLGIPRRSQGVSRLLSVGSSPWWPRLLAGSDQSLPLCTVIPGDSVKNSICLPRSFTHSSGEGGAWCCRGSHDVEHWARVLRGSQKSWEGCCFLLRICCLEFLNYAVCAIHVEALTLCILFFGCRFLSRSPHSCTPANLTWGIWVLLMIHPKIRGLGRSQLVQGKCAQLARRIPSNSI